MLPNEYCNHLWHMFDISHLIVLVPPPRFFIVGLKRFWKHRFQKAAPRRTLIDRLVARPVSLIADQLGYGTAMTL